MWQVFVPPELTRKRWGVTRSKGKTVNDVLKKSSECIDRGTQMVNGVMTAAIFRRNVMLIL